MKKALLISISFWLLAMFVIGCGGSQVTAFTDSGAAIKVSANNEFTIALQANPTTGYDWQPEFDANLLSLIKKDYKQEDHSGKQLVGSGGTDFFTFKALKAGETKITLTYFRPWETPKAEDKRQVFTDVIK